MVSYTNNLGFNEEAVIVSTLSAVPDGKITVALQVALDEAGVPKGLDFTAAIRQLARLANEIIGLFDRP